MDHRNSSNRMEMTLSFKRGLQIWIVVFTALVLYLFYQGRQRSQENQDQIRRNSELLTLIQQSRLKSCKENYAANTVVLDVFFKGRKFPPMEQKRVDKAYAAWNPKRCNLQTAVKKERKK